MDIRRKGGGEKKETMEKKGKRARERKREREEKTRRNKAFPGIKPRAFGLLQLLLHHLYELITVIKIIPLMYSMQKGRSCHAFSHSRSNQYGRYGHTKF